MEIAANQVKQPVLMLISCHIVKGQHDTLRQFCILIINAATVAVRPHHVINPVDRVLCIHQIIFFRASPMIWAVFIDHLDS